MPQPSHWQYGVVIDERRTEDKLGVVGEDVPELAKQG